MALRGGSATQVASAVGMVVAHATPWRAIRAGKQLSDSKGASAAISAEFAVLCARRALRGFVGPADIFRNPEALFRQFEPTSGPSPFDLSLAMSGSDFAVIGMHFKIGLYEHQSAGALQGVVDLLAREPNLPRHLHTLTIRAYEPAFGIIGDPAKRDPRTRQSADHSMVYIVARMLRRAMDLGPETLAGRTAEELWEFLMLLPDDYGAAALEDETTRSLMTRIAFEHGGPDYDARYPDGIPTSVHALLTDGRALDSGLVMYPAGHARNTDISLGALLAVKRDRLASLATDDDAGRAAFLDRLDRLGELSPEELLRVYEVPLAARTPVDG